MSEVDKWFEVRKVLLQYYCSSTLTHGTFILSLALIFLMGLNAYGTFKHLSLERWILFVALPSIFTATILTISIHVIGRTFFWGYLASAAIGINPPLSMGSNPLYDFHFKCFEFVKEKHKRIAWFYKFRMRALIVIWLVLVAALIGFLIGFWFVTIILGVPIWSP